MSLIVSDAMAVSPLMLLADRDIELLAARNEEDDDLALSIWWQGFFRAVVLMRHAPDWVRASLALDPELQRLSSASEATLENLRVFLAKNPLPAVSDAT